MKFKNIKTIKHVLQEYGMKPGVPTPVGQQQTGAKAKVNKNPTTTAPMSPTVTGAKPKQPETPYIKSKAGDIEQDAMYYDDSGKELGVVKTPIGNGPKPDAVVVQDPKSKEYTVVDADDELNINNPDYAQESSSKINKLLNKKDKKNRLHKKIKKLIRKSKLIEQGSEQLFEINFNRKSVAKEALDMPINCGFEAETSWEGISGGSEDENWLDDYSWYDIEDFLSDQEGNSAVTSIENEYEEWISNEAAERESDFVDELVGERKEDEDYLNDFVEAEVDESDIEDYKENYLDGMDDDQLEEYEDWDFIAWGRQYVEEEMMSEFIDYLEEEIRDSGEAMDRAYDDVRDDYDIDRWANYEYGSWNSCLSEFGYYLSNPDGGGGLGEVAEYIEQWANGDSKYDEVKYGDYHSYYGSDQSYWRVESDSSIDSYGTGAEIISPVYKSPREMLTEMKKLFEYFETNNVETNNSTGLHVTMSFAGTQDGHSDNLSVNKVKLAMLLGDKYLLSTFGRKGNSYAKSQMIGLEKLAYKLKSDPDNIKTIRDIEHILMQGISPDKFSSINFKDQKDSKTKNQLIEFRIGGGSDYHREFSTITKAVVRYATTLYAGYDEKAYQSDYVSALFRLINSVGKISADDEERVKGNIEHPALNMLKDFFSKNNYVKYMHKLTGAFEDLENYKKASDPGADKKWKQSIADYEKATGEKVEIEEVEEREPIRGYIQPDATAPSRRAPYYLNKAQEAFVLSVAQAGYDLSQNQNRSPVNAKLIGTMRSTLKEFELNYEKFDKILRAVIDDIEISADRHAEVKPKQRLQRVKNGVGRLFKKDFVKEPEYISNAQVERAIQGMWHAVNSDEIKDSQQSKQFIKLGADAMSGTNRESKEDRLAAFLDELRTYGREYKEFHRHALAGSYNQSAIFVPGTAIDKKAFNKFIDHLKTYPEWNHPVAKGHSTAITNDDSYRENAMSKLLQKMRMRWEHIEDIREENPGLYIDTMREISDLVEYLIDMNKCDEDDKLEDIMPGEGIEDTEFKDISDGPEFMGMRRGVATGLNDALDAISRADPFSDPVAHRLRDQIQGYISNSFERYYYNKKKHGTDYYDKIPAVRDYVESRLNVIQEFLEEFDKISQKLGFDSQQKAIDQKRKLDQKEKEFDKKHGLKYVGTINGFDFGGDIFVSNDFARVLQSDNPVDRDDRTVHRYTHFGDDIHRSERGDVLVIPHAHYFPALEARNILTPTENDIFKGTWREDVAKRIHSRFREKYGIQFNQLAENYKNINEDNLRQLLKKAKVNITKDLGDGRIGVGDFDVFQLDKEEIQGPFGEPFSLSAAAAWKVSNPELAKKAKAKEKEYENSLDRQIPIHADVVDYYDSSSSSISEYTNWNSLARYLGINLGVNDQGVELLKKVYNSFDGNHNWRPEPDPNVCCMPRYVAAVKAAKEYIEKNYTVSGGNYFRKNADGSIGDDVSTVYSSNSNEPNLGEIDSVELTDTSYAEARGDYEKFDAMMQNGMQKYMVQPDVNRLVKFLVGDFSEKYKGGVLHSIIHNQENGGEPVDMQQALALGKRILQLNPQFRESVFDKFDKLSLIEKLQLLDKVDANKINETWKKVSERPLTKGESKLHEIDVKRMMDIINKTKRPTGPRPNSATEMYYFAPDYNRIPKSPKIDKADFRNTVSQFEQWRQSAMFGGLGDISHRTNDIARELWQVYTQIPQPGAEYTDAESWMLAGDWDKAVDIVADGMRMNDAQQKRLADSLAKFQLTGKDANKMAKESLADLEYYKKRKATITPQELEKRTFDKFVRVHGQQKAQQMMYAMKNRDPQYFVKKAKQANESVVSHSLDRRRAQKGKDKYHKAVDVPVSRKIALGQEFDKFEIVKSESGRVGHIVGMIKGKAEDVGSAPIELANALVDAYNRGGFTDLPLQKLDIDESVPNNDKIYKLTKLLKEPILASDLKAQMEVYFVIPDPHMIKDFRMTRAQNGDNADLRSIVRSYMSKLHKDDQKRLKQSLKENRYITVNEYNNLGAEKENIIKTISGLDADNEKHAQILDRIYKLLNTESINTAMDTAFQAGVADELMPEKEKAKVIQDMTRIVGGIDSDYGTMNKFLKRLETTGTIVNLKELSQPINTFQSVFGDDTAINAFIALADYGVGKKQKGPGEYALACLSNQIRLAEGEGDLEIEGIGKVELKAALSSSGGRIGYGGGSQKAKRTIVDKYADSIPSVIELLNAGKGGSVSLPPFVTAINKDLPITDVNNQKVRRALMTELLTMDLEKFAGPVIEAFATSQDATAIEDTYLAQNLRWYQDRDHFDALLLMHIPNRKTAMIRTPEDLIAFRRSGHANSTSISIVPTQAGAGREQWAQLTLNKGAL